MNKVQTDNSFFADKVLLRLRHLPDSNIIRVLDCFSGNGLIWDTVKKYTDKKIIVVRIDKEAGKKGLYLHGDNLKFLKNMDLSKYNVIDIDAYGIPYKQMDILFRRNVSAVVFVTFIQSLYGGIPLKMLQSYGFTRKMINKTPSLFYKKADGVLYNYLASNGVTKIYMRRALQKRYFCFTLPAVRENQDRAHWMKAEL